MKRRRIYEMLISMAALAVMVSVAMITPAGAIAADATADSSAQVSTLLSDEQLQKIIRNLKERNKRVGIDTRITVALGLTTNREVLTVLFRALKTHEGITHAFYMLDDDAGYLVAQTTANDAATVFRLNRNLNPIAAVVSSRYPAVTPYLVALPKVTNTLREELLYWAQFANSDMDAKTTPKTSP